MPNYYIKKAKNYHNEKGVSTFFKFKNKEYSFLLTESCTNGDEVKIYDSNVLKFGLSLGYFILSECNWKENKRKIERVLRNWTQMSKGML